MSVCRLYFSVYYMMVIKSTIAFQRNYSINKQYKFLPVFPAVSCATGNRSARHVLHACLGLPLPAAIGDTVDCKVQERIRLRL